MNLGTVMSAAERRLVRIQERGQVTIPAELRKKLGLKKGDLVAMVDVGDGVLITRQEVLAAQALDKIGAVLREKGLSLEELIESGRDERGVLVEKEYGIRPDQAT